MERNREDKMVYTFPLSSVQSKIVILNEETGKNVVLTPTEKAPMQFELPLFFIEELKQAELGAADRYLVIETGMDFTVRKAVAVSITSQDVYIPRYFYGTKENVKEALPKDRQIVHIFKERPRLIPAFPDDPENLRQIALLEEKMSYYVYMYELPDGALVIYDEHFNPSMDQNTVSVKASVATTNSNLQFNLSGNMTGQGEKATIYALSLWSEQLSGILSVDISVDMKRIPIDGVLGVTYCPPFHRINKKFYYPSSLANQILGYDVSTVRDIKIELNSGIEWYFGLDAFAPEGEYDWITVILHEITHGLGFFSLCGKDGAYTYSTPDNGPYASIFDNQLYWGPTSNIHLTDPALSQAQRAGMVTGNNLYAGHLGAELVKANGGKRVKLYAPNFWQPGSSVSHWDDGQAFDNFMQPVYEKPLHIFNARKIGLMRDLGWEIPCPPVVDIFDRIITANTVVKSCGDINIRNVKIQNGAKLILDAAGEVNIISDFDVASGSEFEIVNP